MRHLPVHWSEGMFLRPQHFQAADRYWNEQIQTSERWDHPYGYGIHHLVFSHESIANYHFQVNSCEVRLKDGTLVSLAGGEEADRVEIKTALSGLEAALASLGADLKEALASSPIVRVYVATPKVKLGMPNVATDGAPGKHAFIATKRQFQDESRGGNDQEIDCKAWQVRLLLSTQDLAGYELLPIAQIQRTGERGGLPQLDPNYIPPLLSIDAWLPLARDFVREIYDLIGKKIESLTELVISRGLTLASQEPGDLDRILMLTQLNEAYATLGVMTFARGVHPYEAYRELCRIVGKLSIFGRDRRVPEVPQYDHDDLARIFKWVKERIIDLLNAIRDDEYEQVYFAGLGLGMSVAIKPKWIDSDWNWYVGVAYENITAQECRELLAPDKLDWKLGSQAQVEMIFRAGKPGLHLVPLDRTPRSLPASRNWEYYEVSRDNAAWTDVQRTKSLAMRLREALIVNRGELEGQRQLIVNHRGKRAVLEFALFAVHLQS